MGKLLPYWSFKQNTDRVFNYIYEEKQCLKFQHFPTISECVTLNKLCKILHSKDFIFLVCLFSGYIEFVGVMRSAGCVKILQLRMASNKRILPKASTIN